MGTTGGGGTSADIVLTQIIFGVDPCTRCWDIAQKLPKCKNTPLTPIVTIISFASFSARQGPPTPKLPRSRPWCLLYPELKFHADRTILRWDILNRTNKTNSKLNITPNATLYGEIISNYVTVSNRLTSRMTSTEVLNSQYCWVRWSLFSQFCLMFRSVYIAAWKRSLVLNPKFKKFIHALWIFVFLSVILSGVLLSPVV